MIVSLVVIAIAAALSLALLAAAQLWPDASNAEANRTVTNLFIEDSLRMKQR